MHAQLPATTHPDARVRTRMRACACALAPSARVAALAGCTHARMHKRACAGELNAPQSKAVVKSQCTGEGNRSMQSAQHRILVASSKEKSAHESA
eukprot:1537713-Pleurochrysis_carterae.AAC.1